MSEPEDTGRVLIDRLALIEPEEIQPPVMSRADGLSDRVRQVMAQPSGAEGVAAAEAVLERQHAKWDAVYLLARKLRTPAAPRAPRRRRAIPPVDPLNGCACGCCGGGAA